MSVASSKDSRRSRDHRRGRRHHQQIQSPAAGPQVEMTSSTVKTVTHAQQQVGASVTNGMRKAFKECEATVKRIAAQYRAKNRKFRDVEFDLENDPQRCLHSLSECNLFATSDVRRVSEIFEKPVFYSGTPKSSEIVMGEGEDCHLVSALSTMALIPQLIENLCVARDEQVGIYGFLFYRDCYWVPVIIDDLLFTRVPKWEQLSTNEKELYHFEKDKYNQQARKGSDSLYFSGPSTDGETWVPLVEKAYAKLHGDYASLMDGRTSDAIEDMTGGVSVLLLSKDILDQDKFWNDELLKANQDRLFGCWFKTLDSGRSGVKNATVDGLVGNMSHSVVKAVEVRGKRFVVLRDPWGDPGWEGPWSDGSKEWTAEWLAVLPELGHSFGVGGQFVMEYKDFLNTWQEIQRTLIFDNTWVMSSQWLHVSLPFPPAAAFSFGDISFAFSLPERSPTIIVFSRYDMSYFKDIQGPCWWNLDFVLAKEGETVPVAESSYSFFFARGVSVEMELEAGDYVVLGRLDPAAVRNKDYFKKGLDNGWNRRKLARIMTERAKGQSIASNYKPNPDLLITPTADVLRSQYTKNDRATIDAVKTHAGHVYPGESITVTTTTTTEQVISKNGPPLPHAYQMQANGQVPMEPGWPGMPPTTPQQYPQYNNIVPSQPQPLPQDLPGPSAAGATALPSEALEDDNSLVVGLKVYTKMTAPTVITGRLKEWLQSANAAPTPARYP